MEKVVLLNLTLEELAEIICDEKYRAKQVYAWIHKGASSFPDMRNIPKELRERLEKEAVINPLKLIKKQESADKLTVKFLFGLPCGNAVESVLMRHDYGVSVCISSQAGCAMGCYFCASATGGKIRNLTAGEMLGQVYYMEKEAGESIKRVDVMGTGEPLDNYENLSRFLKIINDEAGRNLSYRAIVVSTCGIPKGIVRFGKEFRQVNLAVSLHAANDETRSKIMPVANKISTDELLELCRIHGKETGRQVTIEYLLLKGINDSTDDATELADKLKGMLCHVNLIDFNDVSGKSFRKSNEKDVRKFMDILEKKGISVSRRRSFGKDIDGACGQLMVKAGK